MPRSWYVFGYSIVLFCLATIVAFWMLCPLLWCTIYLTCFNFWIIMSVLRTQREQGWWK